MSDEDLVTLFAAFTIALCLVSRIEGAGFGAVRPPQANWQRVEQQVSQSLAEADVQSTWASMPLW